MTGKADQDRPARGRGKRCPECGAGRASDQRYCLSCGTRFGPIPTAIAALLGKGRDKNPAAKAQPPAAGVGASGWPFERSSFMPSPRAAAAAVIGMLALGVAIGSATDKIAQGAPVSTILVEESTPPAAEPAAETAAVEPEPEPVEAEPAPVAAPPPIPLEEPLAEEPLPEEPAPELPELPEEEPPAGMPEIKHVFVVMLGENGYEETFGKSSTSKYLRNELPAEGELLPNYFAVTSGELANQIALLSGQGPTPETEADCPNYGDVLPGTESAAAQVEGNGCVYPATTKSLPRQLAEKKLKWRAYVEGMDAAAAAGQPTTCRHPALGTPDPNQTATAADPYVTWRNPFVYFHSVIDGPECAEADQPLTQLTADLKLKAEKFPAFAYIVADACHRGSEAPCEPNQPAGPAVSEEFLRTVVGQIKESLAYKDGGLLVITSAQARQGGAQPDARSCCVYPAYPNLTPAGEEPLSGPTKEHGGGGQVGALLISPFIEPGTTSESYFNHYSLLASVEELLGLERIGYAAEPAIVGFDESIFNASS